jgi:hypothetical protein
MWKVSNATQGYNRLALELSGSGTHQFFTCIDVSGLVEQAADSQHVEIGLLEVLSNALWLGTTEGCCLMKFLHRHSLIRTSSSENSMILSWVKLRE